MSCRFRVRLGEHDIYKAKDCENPNNCNDPPLDVEIEESIMHPNYEVNNKNFHNDIALLRLQRKVDMTRKLPKKYNFFYKAP